MIPPDPIRPDVSQQGQEPPVSAAEALILGLSLAARDGRSRPLTERECDEILVEFQRLNRLALASASASPHPETLKVSVDDVGDHVCQHGTALDVHCCNCHSGFIFDMEHECPSMNLSLHRCKICGTRWLLWPETIRLGVVSQSHWNLLDQYQRPGSCCDNVAMGDQIEHLRDFPALPASASPGSGEGWQFIESAPKDRSVLVSLKPYPLQERGEITFGYFTTETDEPGGIWTRDETGERIEPEFWFDVPQPPSALQASTPRCSPDRVIDCECPACSTELSALPASEGQKEIK